MAIFQKKIAMNYKTILIAPMILISCNTLQKYEPGRSMNDPGRPISELIKLALEEGDTNAYYSLSVAYLDNPPGEFQPIALKMANKYDHKQAYFDFYHSLLAYNGVYWPGESLEKLDNKTRELALGYLIMGAQKGHEQSMETLKDYYLAKDSKNKEYIFTGKLKEEFGDYLKDLQKK